MSESICCTSMNCNCQCFKPGKISQRQCDQCKHGWVKHALSKLRIHHLYTSGQVEIVQSNVVFDIGSLILYGNQAIPVRLKILLDRLFSVLKQEEVTQILHSLGWTLQDYIRGYVLQDATGKVLDRWNIMSFEEELTTLQQFLRFGETKSIVELMALQDKEAQAVVVPSTRSNSDIRTFIENSNHNRNSNLSNNLEKVQLTNIHHFETIVNNMGFILPFHLSKPDFPPLVVSTADKFLIEQNQKKMNESEQDNHIVSAENYGTGTSPMSFKVESEMHRNIQKAITEENFVASTVNSPNSLPSHSLFTRAKQENIELSPEIKLKLTDKNSSESRKGRVYCTSCEKTFYDKGTLKIHYNAVHLKIKHRCTIDGCNMVFSSLRSRNRHSSNPNPRLHMPMNKNTRDKDLQNTLPVSTCNNDKSFHFTSFTAECKPLPANSNSCTETKVQAFLPNTGQNKVLYPNLKTVQPVLPFYRSQDTSTELCSTADALPSLLRVSPSADKPVPELSVDPLPKKKSRKSSMPIKIEKEAAEAVDDNTDDVSSENDMPIQLTSKGHSEDYGQLYENKIFEKDNKGSRLDKPVAKVEGQTDTQNENGIYNFEENFMTECVLSKNMYSSEQKQPAYILPVKDKQEESVYCASKLNITTQNYETNQTEKLPYTNEKTAQHSLQNEGLCFLFPNKARDTNNFGGDSGGIASVQHFLQLNKDEENPHHCEVCNKAFKNAYSVKMHYESVHTNQMHFCTVQGCSASFPSRRSRDRHSANINLHHKILTKDQTEQENRLLSESSLLKDIFTDIPRASQAVPVSQHFRQTSVIFKGVNRTGSLVFPMSKAQDYFSSTTLSGGGDDDYDDNSGKQSTALDLSTASSVNSIKSGSSSCDSEGGNEEITGVDETDESCDIPSLLPRDESYHSHTLTESNSQNLPSGLPVICHICQKLYSNKGTFRAHYKTVHLRQLHRCKVAGCNTMFSSVRSRNRHSQNPNLHKSLSNLPAHSQQR
ncbi:zinc finger protein basonuclin-1 [Protopterus annectens]|uniref:zinc finger protein basonuclin-1 n=1 Tax=Protopterus annectens TaxID=7888 RepID=UPI001CFAAA1D|nr:zinc finger protein basonuclin-1 [Protopterus annectens]